MSGTAKILLALAAFALAMPVAAQAPAPAPTTFDGKYAGVSADVSKARARGERCSREHIPDTLTIVNGEVHSPARDRWTGTVSPQGSVTLRNRRAMRVEAQIDPDGTIKGQYPGSHCSVAFVWHKQPG
jgi:hypothetical protein